MLEKLINFTIERRYLVLALTGLFIVVGVFAFLRLPFDAFPDTTPVMVQVNVSAPGWAPDDVERQITFPVERELAGLTGLTELRSISKYGLSQTTLIFADEIDIYLARQQVTERLGVVELPQGIEPPRLGPVSTGLGEIFHYVVIGHFEDPTDVRTIQDWVIRPQLQSVPGVAEINSWGGYEKQYQVMLDPSKLLQYKLSVAEIAEALESGVRNVSGGEIVKGGEQTLVQGVGIVTAQKQIAELVVTNRNDVPIRVKDIGDVVVGHEIRRGAASYQGQGEAVLGLGFMVTGQNSHDVAARLAAQLEEIKKTLPQGIDVKPVYVRTDLVDQVLKTVTHNLFFGAALVIAILFIFLGNFRAGLIVASSIPLSMLFAFDAMSRAGIVGSLMSLGAIDFGLAVDNSVIQVENAMRRLSHTEDKRSRFEVIKDAILEVRKPTLFGELIIILVYLPVLTLEGIEGKMFKPMAMTVVFVLIGSLILSFTVIPAAIATFLTKPLKEKEPKVVVWSRKLYKPVLDKALAYQRWVIGGSVAALLIGGFLFLRLGGEFIPRLSEGTIAVNIIRLAGISAEQSVDNNTRMEQILIERFPDEVADVWSRIGTAELATDPMGLELTDMFITLKPRSGWTKASTQNELVERMDAELSDMPGMNRVFTQPIEMRVNEMIAGIRADVGIKLFGDDLALLESKAEEITRLVESIPGAADVSAEQLTGQPEMRLTLEREQIARYGIKANEVLAYIEAMGGITVGEVYEDQRRFDLVLLLDTTHYSSPEDISRLWLASGNKQLPLTQLVHPTLETGYSTITREWAKRRTVIQTNVRGRDVESFVDELQERINKEISLPAGYYVRFGGQFENLERAKDRLAIVVPLALLLIFGLLYMTYHSIRDALLIFTGVPLAALGGILALETRGMPFSISAGVGFIALFGIAVLNGMVLISYVRQLRDDGHNLIDAIRESALVRLRPVLMTALVAAVGFIPMALSTGIGSEVQRPLATVVVGGILTSTILTLIVLPVLYMRFGEKKSRNISSVGIAKAE